MDDAAAARVPAARVWRSRPTPTSFSPVFFPGGDIGRLAVCGTVNDVATAGATPLYLSVGFVLEEGFPVADLKRILDSMARRCREAGVRIVTGDTKVVEKGHGDGVFINTAGVGVLAEGRRPVRARTAAPATRCCSPARSATTASPSSRFVRAFSSRPTSRPTPRRSTFSSPTCCKRLPSVRCFRDPTRGGLSSTLNELASASGVSITVVETEVPVHDQVRGASEMLGYDVFQVANEGKMVAIVPPEQAEAALAAMKVSPYGEEAAIIGDVAEGPAGKVYVHTAFGATRVMDMLVGEQLPRIC